MKSGVVVGWSHVVSEHAAFKPMQVLIQPSTCIQPRRSSWLHNGQDLEFIKRTHAKQAKLPLTIDLEHHSGRGRNIAQRSATTPAVSIFPGIKLVPRYKPYHIIIPTDSQLTEFHRVMLSVLMKPATTRGVAVAIARGVIVVHLFFASSGSMRRCL